MTTVASSLINWSALWKIVVAALVGGAGVVMAFGLLLLGLKYARSAHGEAGRFASIVLSSVCGIFCVGAVVVGIYAMTQKPASKKPSKPKSAAVTRPSRGDRS